MSLKRVEEMLSDTLTEGLQRYASLVFVELPLDVAPEILQPAAQNLKILTEVFDPTDYRLTEIDVFWTVNL